VELGLRLRRRSIVIAAAAAAALALTVAVGLTAADDPAHVRPLRSVGAPSALPLPLAVGDATQVVTVVAASTSSASAVLQAWERTGGLWRRMGPMVTSHVATGGLTAVPREYDPATPLGSFGLTQAFGKLPNPGTGLPFFQLTSADWWISQAGPLYNTHQVCAVACPFSLGRPNTHLIDAKRAYNYAVAIDYNRSTVVQGAGSAYFLHVTTAGKPTRGCISVPQSAMMAILRWLRADAHPRILIGIG
jgi:L,D-peptidoglycan transpeptidase YkuD (ErfK/YbiS/YcfS/YnhG family)